MYVIKIKKCILYFIELLKGVFLKRLMKKLKD